MWRNNYVFVLRYKSDDFYYQDKLLYTTYNYQTISLVPIQMNNKTHHSIYFTMK